MLIRKRKYPGVTVITELGSGRLRWIGEAVVHDPVTGQSTLVTFYGSVQQEYVIHGKILAVLSGYGTVTRHDPYENVIFGRVLHQPS